MDLKEKLITALNIMRASERILIVSHLRPDGDALSSVAALRLIGLSLGKKVYSFCQDKNQDLLSYLPGFNDIYSNLESLKKDLNINFLHNYFDLIIVADCGSLARTAIVDDILAFKNNKGGKIIEFDHHPRIDNYADLEIRCPELSSTAELVYNFIKANNLFFNQDLADCILTGILTDTGNFLYPSTSNETMKAASDSLVSGAHYNKIIHHVLHNKDITTIKMWGLALERLKLNSRYQIAFTVITREDIKKIFNQDNFDSASESDFFSGLAGFLSNLSGVKAVMLLYEDSHGFIKGSLRSTSNGFLVDKLARFLGGGGHERAAGFSLPGYLKKIDQQWQVVKNK